MTVQATSLGLATRLQHHVRVLSETLSPRDFAHPKNMAKAADYIATEFSRSGGLILRQPFEVDGHPYQNVLCRFGYPTTTRIVVGAHYDTAGPYPGADDNASGVAGLLELAALLSLEKFEATVELAAYALEEPPFFRSKKMGSYIHAQSLKKDGIHVPVMICLEMIGYFTEEPNSQSFPLPFLSRLYPKTGNFIVVAGNLGQGKALKQVKGAMQPGSDLPVHIFQAPPLIPGIDFSDHRNFWRFGYPAVMITDSAFYRNPYYHTPLDTPDTLDYERMAKVVLGIRSAVLAYQDEIKTEPRSV